MTGEKNPVTDWVLRCAKECGTPDALLEEAERMSNENTKFLLVSFASRWATHLQSTRARSANFLIEVLTNGKA